MFKKQTPLPPLPDDIAEARRSRERAVATLEKVNAQSNYVSRLSDRMAVVVEARKFDHFGDLATESFTRKGL